jgi:hypothetical protein
MGDNLTSQKSELLKAWYKGPTLIDAIDQLEPPARAVNHSCRFVVSDVYKDTQSGMGVCVGGKVECTQYSWSCSYFSSWLLGEEGSIVGAPNQRIVSSEDNQIP